MLRLAAEQLPVHVDLVLVARAVAVVSDWLARSRRIAFPQISPVKSSGPLLLVLAVTIRNLPRRPNSWAMLVR